MLFLALLVAAAAPPAATDLPVIVRRRPRAVAEAQAEAAPAPAEAEGELPPAPRSEAPAIEALPLPERRLMIGEWSLALSAGSRRCSVRLDDYRWSEGFYTASMGANCPEALFTVTRWRLQERELQLANRTGRVLARLTQEKGYWSGQQTEGETALVMAKRPR